MKNKLNNGFTLVELIIAVAVGMIIMTAIYAMINLGQGSTGGISRRVLTQQDARAVLNLMAMEVGMASFNPTSDNAVWGKTPLKADDTACVDADVPSPFLQVRRGIQTAGPNSILVSMNLNADTKIGGNVTNSENEYIRYSFDSNTGTIKRAVSCGGDQPIVGGANSSTMIRNNVAGVPLFQYFNTAGTDISANVINTPDAQPGNGGISDIRRIRINISADVENDDKRGTFKTSRRTYSTDVLVRNHALSQ